MQSTRAIFYRIFYDILLAMDEDWSDGLDRDRSVLSVMSSNANLSRRCSNVLISINTTAAVCYAATSFTRHSAGFKENLNDSLRVLPLKMQFPFEVNASPLFELLAVAQFLHVVSIAALVAMINCLIITLVSFTDDFTEVDDTWLSERSIDFTLCLWYKSKGCSSANISWILVPF